MNPKYKLGLRAVKTAISVFLCLLISLLFHRSELLLGSIAAIICIQPTYDETFLTGIRRLVGTLIGGIIGYLILLLIHNLPFKSFSNLLIAPISILIVIYICNLINYPESVVISCIVVLSVIMWPTENVTDTLMYVVNRVVDTSIGVIIAMLVNKFTFQKRSTNFK